jgi:hypothetical protein
VVVADTSNWPGQPGSPDPKNDNERRNRRTQIVVAIIAALGVVIVALISAKPWHHNNPCPQILTITSPSAGQHVDGAQGVEVTGKSCSMGESTGWLFDYDTNDEHYYMDYPVNSPDNAAPIIVSNGGWSYDDAPIGSPGDRDQTYGITVVLASSTCTKKLESAKPDAQGDIRYTSFPSGCMVETTVDVEVTYH